MSAVAKQSNLIIFEINDQRFALGIKHIDKIVDTERVFHVPGAVPPVKGAVTIGQETVIVADMSRIFGTPPFFDDDGRIIVMRDDESRVLGLHIGIQKVLFVWSDDMATAQFMPQKTSNYVAGAVKVGENILKFIDWRYIYDDIATRLSERRAS